MFGSSMSRITLFNKNKGISNRIELTQEGFNWLYDIFQSLLSYNENVVNLDTFIKNVRENKLLERVNLGRSEIIKREIKKLVVLIY